MKAPRIDLPSQDGRVMILRQLARQLRANVELTAELQNAVRDLNAEAAKHQRRAKK